MGVIATPVKAAEWQWSVPDGPSRAYLWIPSHCKRVRAVVVANHNMIEQGILEHPTMRKTLADLGMAEVWVVPGMDIAFDFNTGAGEHFDQIIGALAEESGYTELRDAPVVPLGHSSYATFPWNFAAWNPARTLAVLSVHGDAPQTNLTGYGRPNVDWGNRSIDGVPGLMVMGEYEWWEDRLTPALRFQAQHPRTPLTFLADAGHGHFDYSDRLVAFLAMFIRKAASLRLPKSPPTVGPVTLKPVDAKSGWLIDRWHRDQSPAAPSAPRAKYTGDPAQAFWAFDGEMAKATETFYATARGKMPQLLSVTDGQMSPQQGVGEPVTPQFIAETDGITFRLQSAFMSVVPPDNGKATLWTGLPANSSLGHATGGGPIVLSRSVGPVVQTGPDTFAVSPGRAEYTANRRNNDMWILATHPGDSRFKSAVQQVLVRAVPNADGTAQQITFLPIPDQKAETKTLRLNADSDAGMPVHYYVLEGPVEVEGDILRFTPIPPRAKFPMKVTVVAWQWGRSFAPKLKTALPVTRTFFLQKKLKHAAH